MIQKSKSVSAFRVIAYILCGILTLLSILPFWFMIMNATRAHFDIMQQSVAFIPGDQLLRNYRLLMGGDGRLFNPWIGFLNSIIISTGVMFCSVYFSSLTAYALVIYNWRLRNAFFTLILGIMMIPATISAIGYIQFIYGIGLTNNYLPLILPAIAAPGVVFFMRQYLIAALHPDIVSSARVDGASEFFTFNRIVLPLMTPAIATQAIFVFVGSWNNYLIPSVLLTNSRFYTTPIMVSLLTGDIYRREYGSIYLALTLSVIPLFTIYFLLSKYIIAGVALGGIKE